MRALQAFLAIMGILIVAGFVVIGVEIYNRMTSPERAIGSGQLRPSAVNEIALGLPEGAHIVGMTPVGSRLVFQVGLPDGRDRLYILNPSSGEITGTVSLSNGDGSRLAPADRSPSDDGHSLGATD